MRYTGESISLGEASRAALMINPPWLESGLENFTFNPILNYLVLLHFRP